MTVTYKHSTGTGPNWEITGRGTLGVFGRYWEIWSEVGNIKINSGIVLNCGSLIFVPNLVNFRF